MRFPVPLAIALALAPLILLFVDFVAILLGVDRMNEIDRVTPVTLWVALGGGVMAGASQWWLMLVKGDRESMGLKLWAATLAWGPLSAFLVCWSLNAVATIVPGETSEIQATAQSFRRDGRSLCSRYITLQRRWHADPDEVCLTGAWGRRVGPSDLSVGDELTLIIHTTAIGGTVESIRHADAQ